METFSKVVGIVLLGFVTIAVFSILFCFPFMWSWNFVMPYLFALKTLTWGQAWCLMFVSGILFKSTSKSK